MRKRKKQPGLKRLYISRHTRHLEGLEKQLADTKHDWLVVNNGNTLAEALLKKIYYCGAKGDDFESEIRA